MGELIVEPIEKFGLSEKRSSKTLFSKVGVVGCGAVGQTIVLLISQKELEVVFIELSEEKVANAIHRIEMELDSMIDHWGMTPGEKKLSFQELTDMSVMSTFEAATWLSKQ
jgi:3-hydroxybutyryl-CoA dehydrogenase